MIDSPDVVETTAIKCKSSKNSKRSINMQNAQITFFFPPSSLLKRFHTYVCFAPLIFYSG